MLEFLSFINYVINLYSYVVFAAVIMSFLLAFNVVNPRNQIVQTIWNALTALTEPLLGPIRRALPDFGPIDLSPVVLLLGLYFIQSVVLTNIAKALI
ncbi:MAG: YggT family protein [Hyphomicrobium sp.]|jgi:YggT family protein|nr:YggT family protein [Hyphomicrobium sp.]